MYKAVGRSEHMGEGGRSVNPISTRRVDYTNQITTCSPDFQTFLPSCIGAELVQLKQTYLKKVVFSNLIF